MEDSPFPATLRDRYVPLATLGEGAMGVVFLARDRQLEREVALKLARGEVDAGLAARFERECSWLAQVRHPHIVELYDHGLAEGRPYLVMQRLEGRSLDRIPDLGDPLPALLAIAEALEAVHQAGLVHRDVKPGNIFVTRDGRPVLLDFGLVRATEQTCLTATGHVVGTPAFLAPESLRGDATGPPADWWAWGVCLYQLCEGGLPFSMKQVVAWMGGGGVPPLHFASLRGDDPRRRLVAACLQEDPAARPRSRRQLEELRVAPSPAPPATPPPRNPPPRAGGLWLRLVPALLLGLTAVAFLAGDPRADGAAATPAPAPSVAVTPPGDPMGALEARLVARGLEALGPNDKGAREYRNPADGGRLILIPGGPFTSHASARPGRRGPAQRLLLEPFLVDAHEVSVARYARFLAATGARRPSRWARQLEHPDFPVVLVTADQAAGYCAWAGGRLPTELEWERAAAGADGQDFPWGDAPPREELLNFGHSDPVGLLDPFPFLRPVDTMRAGRSPCGAFHMAGNVMEWTRQDGAANYMGGNYLSGAKFSHTWYTGNSDMLFTRAVGVGFRLFQGVG